VGGGADSAKSVQVAAGNGSFYFFTFSDRWKRENPGQQINPNALGDGRGV
jgi:hypothetical protein